MAARRPRRWRLGHVVVAANIVVWALVLIGLGGLGDDRTTARGSCEDPEYRMSLPAQPPLGTWVSAEVFDVVAPDASGSATLRVGVREVLAIDTKFGPPGEGDVPTTGQHLDVTVAAPGCLPSVAIGDVVHLQVLHVPWSEAWRSYYGLDRRGRPIPEYHQHGADAESAMRLRVWAVEHGGDVAATLGEYSRTASAHRDAHGLRFQGQEAANPLVAYVLGSSDVELHGIDWQQAASSQRWITELAELPGVRRRVLGERDLCWVEMAVLHERGLTDERRAVVTVDAPGVGRVDRAVLLRTNRTLTPMAGYVPCGHALEVRLGSWRREPTDSTLQVVLGAGDLMVLDLASWTTEVVDRATFDALIDAQPRTVVRSS